jgi:hypothetical protein
MNANEHSITVETDLFEHRQTKPHFINACCFGEDFAGWLKRELSASVMGMAFSEPVQEDYGWGFWASYDDKRFWVALSYVGNGPQEAPAEWIVSVIDDPGPNPINRLFHKSDRPALEDLRHRIRQILTSNDAIRVLK